MGPLTNIVEKTRWAPIFYPRLGRDGEENGNVVNVIYSDKKTNDNSVLELYTGYSLLQ